MGDNMKKLITTVAIVFLFSSQFVAFADNLNFEDKYWGVGLGMDDGSDFRFFAGARLKENLGAEVGYTDLGNADGFYLTGLAKIKGSDKVDLFGKFGFLRWSKDGRNDESGLDPFFGFGAIIKFKDDMDIIVDYSFYEVDNNDKDMFSIGLKFSLR